MANFEKIIFVCNGDTCRSPMAAAIMTKLNPKVVSVSRGMVVLFPEPYNPKAVAVAAKHEIIIPNESAEQISNEDFGNSTMVLTMNGAMKQKLYDDYSEAINVYTLGEYAGDAGIEIPDPYGKGIEEYNDCFELLYGLIEKIAEELTKSDDDKATADNV